MERLKQKSSKKCLSILRQFINEVPSNEGQREVAILAIDQLQRITAGRSPRDLAGGSEKRICIGKPLADASL